MELQSTIIGLSILALCIYTFILLGRSRRNKEKRLIGQLNKLASARNKAIKELEIGFDFALAIDDTEEYLYFTKENQAEFDDQVIALSGVRKCEMITLKKRLAKEEYLNKITLIFTTTSDDSQNHSIVLFDSDKTSLPNGEPMIAIRWVEKVSGIVQKRKPKMAMRKAV